MATGSASLFAVGFRIRSHRKTKPCTPTTSKGGTTPTEGSLTIANPSLLGLRTSMGSSFAAPLASLLRMAGR